MGTSITKFGKRKRIIMISYPSSHSFHIPVMGLAFTIDTPIKVARFGIPSVVSIVEDRLIETMRKYYSGKFQFKYKAIPANDPDHRARRITEYLNLMNRIVNEQVEKLKTSAFRRGSEIVKYFEMLPDDSKLKQLYRRMTETSNDTEKLSLQIFLRSQIRPGNIDVNIMTKVDKNNYDKEGNEMLNNSDALASLRGYALSDLCNSSVVFSAGLNPRLFNYIDQFPDFDATDWGTFKKKITIKVSDYRSALIQGKVLAKKGIWVSEFRIESGLNCGGHTFATDGFLLGPIMEEFKKKREALADELHQLYMRAAEARGKRVFLKPHPIRISVQGGIGTAAENQFLRDHYDVDSTGWGTPFLLCPEATTVDEATLRLLQDANEQTVVLSKSSPLGIRFQYLKGTSSEAERHRRIETGRPGSPCTEKHLASNTEFTLKPICTASQTYQSLKLEQLQSLNLTPEEYGKRRDEVLARECLCLGLSNSASLVYQVPFVKKLTSVTMCPGPNIINFSKVVTLSEMVDHIYGRRDLITNPLRPHMFIKELQLYVDHFIELAQNLTDDAKQITHCNRFYENVMEGIAYYKALDEAEAFGIMEELERYEAVLRSAYENTMNVA
jgi:hypothetical protein